MRKIFTLLILAGLAISWGYGHSILTALSDQGAKAEVNARPAGRIKVQRHPQSISIRPPDSPTQDDVRSFREKLLSAVDSAPILWNYLNELKPDTQEELVSVLNVAAEAQQQLLQEQTPTREALETVKSKIRHLTQTLPDALALSAERYVENLDRRREIKREIAFQNEQKQGWTLEAEAGMDRLETLTAAENLLQHLHNELAALDMELDDYEAKIVGSEYQSYRNLLDSYKRESAAALDQEVILDKFDSIFAAMNSVRLD